MGAKKSLALLVLRDETDVYAGHHLADVDTRLQLGLGGTALHTFVITEELCYIKKARRCEPKGYLITNY